jgi:hypothetical protein
MSYLDLNIVMSDEELHIPTLEDETATQSRNTGTSHPVTRRRIPEGWRPQIQAVEA